MHNNSKHNRTEQSGHRASQPTSTLASPTKKNKYYVPEGHINLDTNQTRSQSNGLNKPRRSIQPHKSKQSAGKTLEKKL